ncbi:hypothetical protein SCUCBS95973_007674 [Sporothrix curviconia]|uniref:Myb-like DNA-binding domain-containing protein n=1 Tax=Sporothrix curviconia TaxID=1260050 RepID=A0ABP0CF95_9PEZI
MSGNEQISFLLACIKHATVGGKIDFEAVAKELTIPSKAAAAKRYERLKKRALTTDFDACTAAVDGDGPGGDSNTVASPKPKRTPAKPRASKSKAALAIAAAAEASADDSSVEDVSGEASASAAATATKDATTPRPTKRKRTASDISEGEETSVTGQSVADHEDAGIETTPSYTGSRFVAVNTSPACTLKQETEPDAVKLCSIASAAVAAFNAKAVADTPVFKFEDMNDDGI